MFDLCKGFALMPPVKGGRLAIVTNSGGPGVMTADRAESSGLLAPEASDSAKAALSAILPSYAGIRNPIDLTVEGTGAQYAAALSAMLPECDAAAALYIGTPYLDSLPVAEGITEAAVKSGKPVAAVMMVGDDLPESVALLEGAGVPCYPSGERAASVMAAMSAYWARRPAIMKEAGTLRETPPGPAERGEALGGGGEKRLTDAEAMSLLRRNGIPAPECVLARDEDETAKAAASIGYPVAIKISSPEIIHKSDCGGVALNVKDEAGARAAFREMERIGRGKNFQGVSVSPMLPAGREMIIGLARDPVFGPVVAFGMGGVYAEVLRDVAFRVAPVTEDEAAGMIREIRAYPVIRGVRGETAADEEALARAISAFSALPFRYPNIEEAEVNPLMAYERGVMAADVRVLA
jgi:acetyltransferase